ncbi:flippase [Lactobacillus koreensis] [Lactiplantibacillus mudanjiangensis]|uniref:oligosaccharide flippase family protein n=1 Tax=Lactiplantibacillus mudanjiangensis TaxID=1296538 RepID=UPI00101446FB|nr:flippase [Lactobacillus koreensis] [Lactiplantibacillus mudanjiangensis]
MKVIRNYLYNASYQILNLITPFITVPYIARILGPKGVGINSFTNSIVTYFVLAGTLGLTIYGNREVAYNRDDPEKLSKTFWEIEILQLTTMTLSFICFLLFIFFYGQYTMFLLMQSLLIISGAFDISWFFMGLEDFKKTVLRNMFVKVIALIAIFTFVRHHNDVAIYIAILGCTQLFGNLSLWPYLKKIVNKVPISSLEIWHHLRPAIILFIPQVAIQVYLQVNKTMLGQLDSVVASGYYDYADKLVKMVLAVVTATGTVMLPHMSNLFAKGNLKKVNEYLYRSFNFISAIAVPLSFGIAAVATALAPWYYGSKFAVVGQLLILESPVVLIIGWSNALGQQYLMPTKQIKKYTWSVVFGAIANIIVNVPLIIVFGVKGATLATLISEVVVTGYQLISVHSQIDYRRLFSDLPKYLISGIVMFIVVYNLNVSMKISIFSLILQVVEGMLVYLGMILILQPKIILEINGILSRHK